MIRGVSSTMISLSPTLEISVAQAMFWRGSKGNPGLLDNEIEALESMLEKADETKTKGMDIKPRLRRAQTRRAACCWVSSTRICSKVSTLRFL